MSSTIPSMVNDAQSTEPATDIGDHKYQVALVPIGECEIQSYCKTNHRFRAGGVRDIMHRNYVGHSSFL
jgi:hypothetical protein